MSLLGTVLKERYYILESIGKGGSGSVYLARDMQLGVLWAVKEISISEKQEAKMMLKLSHPSLPKILDYVENEKRCYLVMEYIHGKTLGQLLREERRFSTSELLRYAREIADILAYLHNRKPPIYYGDLKPDNLMLDENNRLYLIDLGSAVNGYGSNYKNCRGTPGFAAPEQYNGKLNAQSDVYAFGKTLSALIDKNKILSLARNISVGYLIFRCCRKNPCMRYRNMEVIQKKLQKIQRTQGHSRMKNMLLLSGCAIFFSIAVIYLIFGQQQIEAGFYEKMTTVTDLYYQKGFQEGDEKEQKKICEKAEKMLQKLQEEYKGKEESRKILLLLAGNSEYQGKIENAALYYEQLLLYDETCKEGYGEYGMFLLRTDQREKAEKLWKKYNRNIQILDESEGRDLAFWEKEMRAHE